MDIEDKSVIARSAATRQPQPFMRLLHSVRNDIIKVLPNYGASIPVPFFADWIKTKRTVNTNNKVIAVFCSQQ
jgi:hypothetical protein